MPPSRWSRACALLVTALVPASRVSASDPAEAMVFVSVFGDFRVAFASPWKEGIAEEDLEIGTGSGFVISPAGLILTNRHVVEGSTVRTRVQGEEAQVTTTVKRIEVVVGKGDGRQTFEPWVLAEDAELDLAVLQVNTTDLRHLPFGDSDAAETGGRTRVLGFPFGRRLEVGKESRVEVVPDVTVTAGSLSAARADDQGGTRYLQTDASVHPGNSGGPMVDGEGYAIGVVRMKVAAGRSQPGPGFSVPINMVKDFLDRHGLLEQLPTARLRRGVVHGLDWKRFGLELPDGLTDTSSARLRLDSGDSGGPFSVRVDRVLTPWTVMALEEALLQGTAVSGFVPGAAGSKRRIERGRPARVLGTAVGASSDGREFRVEYALLDLGREKVVARYLAPPDDMAFNLSLVRSSLEGLEATRLLTDEVRAPLPLAFEPASSAAGILDGLPLPAGWVAEPAERASCEGFGPVEGLAASPPGDFTVVFRALRISDPRNLEKAIRDCGGSGTGASAYMLRFGRLGLNLQALGVVAHLSDEALLLEVEAPEGKLGFARELFDAWVERIGGASK